MREDNENNGGGAGRGAGSAKPLLISFEGVDGCGKSELSQRVKLNLLSLGHDVLLLREPGGTGLGEETRRLLKSGEGRGAGPMSQFFLFEAARAQLVREKIVPALAAGRIVLLDRFVDSTLAYQQALGIDKGLINAANKAAANGLLPNLTFFIDTPVAECMERARRRNAVELAMEKNRGDRGGESEDKAEDKDRDGGGIGAGAQNSGEDGFDSKPAEFFERVRGNYLEIAKYNPRRVATLDGLLPREVLPEVAMKRLAKLLDNGIMIAAPEFWV